VSLRTGLRKLLYIAFPWFVPRDRFGLGPVYMKILDDAVKGALKVIEDDMNKFLEEEKKEKKEITRTMNIVALNPILNASLNEGHRLTGLIFAAGNISSNPRLYAEETGSTGYMVPEFNNQDNSDLPTWATNNWDGSTTLESISQDPTQPIYLQVWLTERQNFYDVAQTLKLVDGGTPLDVALSPK
jgi:hypothetical protein